MKFRVCSGSNSLTFVFDIDQKPPPLHLSGACSCFVSPRITCQWDFCCSPISWPGTWYRERDPYTSPWTPRTWTWKLSSPPHLRYDVATLAQQTSYLRIPTYFHFHFRPKLSHIVIASGSKKNHYAYKIYHMYPRYCNAFNLTLLLLWRRCYYSEGHL